MAPPDRMIIRVCKVWEDEYMAYRSWTHNDRGEPSVGSVVKCTQKAGESIKDLEQRVVEKAIELGIEFNY